MALSRILKTPKATFEQPLGLFINNEFVPGRAGKMIETINPHNEKPIVSVHEALAEDIDIAVAAARKALSGPWQKFKPSERGRLMMHLADLMESNKDILSAVESLDNGKAFEMAKYDVESAAACIRYYGGWADKVHGQVIDTDPDTFNYTRHEPLGVCGQIIPWNFPILLFSWKIAPALATGNTIVLKPSELTPLSALQTARLIVDAGFPPGVVNILPGLGNTAGVALTSHMDVDKMSFTGSTAAGRNILVAAARSNLKNCTLELGGKSPNIIFADADLDNAVAWVNFGIYFNHGQCCSAGSRVLVSEDIYPEFLHRFKERTLQNKVGDPFSPDTFQGPQISKTQFDRILGYIEEGKAAGAIAEVGGERLGTEGYYIQPTVFTKVTEDMKIVKEEIFGPVCTVQTFKTEEEAVRIANNTSYGLAAAVHTTNLNTALRVSNNVKAGTVWVNAYNMLSYQTPFGGFKESGLGRDLGQYALEHYSQIKAVRIRMSENSVPV